MCAERTAKIGTPEAAQIQKEHKLVFRRRGSVIQVVKRNSQCMSAVVEHQDLAGRSVMHPQEAVLPPRPVENQKAPCLFVGLITALENHLFGVGVEDWMLRLKARGFSLAALAEGADGAGANRVVHKLLFFLLKALSRKHKMPAWLHLELCNLHQGGCVSRAMTKRRKAGRHMRALGYIAFKSAGHKDSFTLQFKATLRAPTTTAINRYPPRTGPEAAEAQRVRNAVRAFLCHRTTYERAVAMDAGRLDQPTGAFFPKT